jgi:hypothetical protein
MAARHAGISSAWQQDMLASAVHGSKTCWHHR